MCVNMCVCVYGVRYFHTTKVCCLMIEEDMGDQTLKLCPFPWACSEGGASLDIS